MCFSLCEGGRPTCRKTLEGMPIDALPQTARKGKLSYTVTSPHTGAKVEVLLKQKAFRISRQGMVNGPLAQKHRSFVLYLKWSQVY